MKKFTLYKQFITFFTVASLLGGCTTKDNYDYTQDISKTQMGAVIGGVLGALIGTTTKGDNKAKRAMIGGVLGATVGGVIGYSLDQQAKEVAQKLETNVNNDPNAVTNKDNDLIVSNSDKFVKITLRDSMVFPTDSAFPTQEASQKIAKISDVLKDYPNTIVQVVGFTDNRGTYEYNLKLSEQRASNVGNTIYKSGITNQIFSKGCSYNKPVVPNDNLENMALNRRVEIYLYPNEASVIDACKN